MYKSNENMLYDSRVNHSASYSNITLDDVRKIESILEFYELISLVFLIYDDNDYALQKIRSMIAQGPREFIRDMLSTWAYTQPPHWKMKLLEGLTIIQNYKVLKDIGFSRKQVDVDFQPGTDTSLYVNRCKKMLYSVCESLNKEEAGNLVELVRCDAKFESDITHCSDPVFLEFHVLFWISQNYITIDKEISLTKLTNHLKHLNFLDKVEEINMMIKSIKNRGNFSPSKVEKGTPEAVKVQNVKSDIKKDECYKIKDPNHVGLLIIINMMKFQENIENRKEFKDLVSTGLPDREGSEKDVEELKKTFNKLKFHVVEIHDLYHDEIITHIERKTMKHFSTMHSVFILAILSHGIKGKIFGVNSVPVSVENIKKCISGTSKLTNVLEGIPKIIIIQACQGPEPIKCVAERRSYPMLLVPDSEESTHLVQVDESDLKFDGKTKHKPTYDGRDILVCLSIIPGFASLRNTKTGSPYIQELCSFLKEYHKEKPFQDIILKVHEKFNNSIFKKENVEVLMTPEMRSCTLTKKLYLSPQE